MRKLACILLVLAMMLSMITVGFAAEKKTLTAGDLTEKIGDVNVVGDAIEVGGNYTRATIGFANVDLTGVKSITINTKEYAGMNGEIFRIKIDDPNALSIGEVVFGNKNASETGNIEEQTGVHTLYIATTLTTTGLKWEIESITLNDDAKAMKESVPESAVIDNRSDTWAATDSYGRRVADYEEAGPVKEGLRKVGMFYWFAGFGHNGVTSDILREHPDAFGNFKHEAWHNGGQQQVYAWGTPIYGFYDTSREYWVRRKHASVLGNAGVDSIFLDYTNDAYLSIDVYNAVVQAFSDARKEGINAPAVSIYGSMSEEITALPKTYCLLYGSIRLSTANMMRHSLCGMISLCL